jgi:hypothetical protein
VIAKSPSQILDTSMPTFGSHAINRKQPLKVLS